jgi:hypothetical protein
MKGTQERQKRFQPLNNRFRLVESGYKMVVTQEWEILTYLDDAKRRLGRKRP